MSSTLGLLEGLIRDHDWSEDFESGETSLGAQACWHWADWGNQVQLGGPDLMLEGESSPADSHLSTALRLLSMTGVPESWVVLAGAIPALDPPLRSQAVRTLGAALNVEFAKLLTCDDTSRDRGICLAHIFEAINFLDDWCIIADNDSNYIPQWGIEQWLKRYLRAINSTCSHQDLRELSAHTQEDMCITEALSELADPAQLVAAASANSVLSAVYAQAPNLPADYVNDRLRESEYLIFHPKADHDLAWAALEEMLVSSPDDAIQLMGPFDNLRDRGWGTVMGYPHSGPQADALRSRARQWCLENPDDGEDLLMEIFDE